MLILFDFGYRADKLAVDDVSSQTSLEDLWQDRTRSYRLSSFSKLPRVAVGAKGGKKGPKRAPNPRVSDA